MKKGSSRQVHLMMEEGRWVDTKEGGREGDIFRLTGRVGRGVRVQDGRV